MYGLNLLLRASFMGVLATAALYCVAAHGLVISQIYGGGGNSGAPYKNDFIEIFNNSATDAIVIDGFSVQYAPAAGSTWSVTPLSGILDPYHYYLIQEGAGSSGNGVLLPTPDAAGKFSNNLL